MKNYRAPRKYQPGSILSKRIKPAILGLTLLGASVSSAVEVTYQYYRFTPTRNYQDADAVGTTPAVATTNVQLAEFTFSLRGSLLNINGNTGSGSAVTVTATGGSNPDTSPEAAKYVVDGDLATKWYNADRTNPLVFNFGAPTTIDAYNFATANDSLNRTPVSWTLEGSTNGTTWVVVDSKANIAPTAELKFYQGGFSIDGSTALPAIDFGTTAAANAGLLNIALPGIVKNGTASSLTWAVTGSTAVTLASPGVATPAAVAATGTQSISPAANTESSYTLAASNATGADAVTQKVRTVPGGVTTYHYYRFTTTGRRGGPNDNRVQLSGFEFYGGTAEREIIGVTNPGGLNAGATETTSAETPDMLVDDNTGTKWLDFNNKPLIFELTPGSNGKGPTVDSYQFFTANDFPDRDPVRWTLEGSNDLDGAWTIVDAVDGTGPYPTPSARLAGSGNIPITGTPVHWAGIASNAWNTTALNFRAVPNTTGTGVAYRDGLAVVFDDTATQTAVTLGATFQPAWLSFANSAKNFTLTGGSLTGQMQVVKTGAGTASLGSANSFTGDIAINNGTLIAAAPDALGPRTLNRKITLTSLFTDSPALQVNETQGFQGPLVITGDVLTSGTIGVGDTFTFNHYGTVQIDTTLVKTDKGTLHLENYKGSNFNPVDSIDDLVINAGLVEFGSSYFNSSPVGVRNFVATINAGGVLRLAADHALGGDYYDLQTSWSQIKVLGGTLRVNGSQYLPTALVNNEGSIVLDGGVIDGGFTLATGYIDPTANRPIGRSTITTRPNAIASEIRNVTFSLNDGQMVFDVADGAAADDLLISGNNLITGTFGIVKTGTGNLTLARDNDYTGKDRADTYAQPDGTTVVAGTLTVANTTGTPTGTGSATGAGTVLVKSGATLAGTGFITGATTVAGSITPGRGTTPGTLSLGNTTLTGSLKARVNGAAFDQLAVTGDLNLTGATLALTATNPTAASYVIARYTGTLTGSFASVTGLPTGYTLVSDAAAKTIAIQSGTPQSGFDAWASAAGLTGADALSTADPDGDGVKNGIEFVIGGNPKAADLANLPTAVRDSSGNLVFTFRRTSASAYLNPGVQYSADLVTWTAAPANSVLPTTDGFGTGVDRVVVTLPASLAPGSKLFARLVDTTNAQ